MAQYNVHTNITTPYWNCPTKVLEKKVKEITDAIEKVNTISGDELDFLDATHIAQMLYELRRTVINQIEDRERVKRAIPEGSEVTIIAKDDMHCGDWGIVLCYDGELYTVAMFGDTNDTSVFGRDDFKVTKRG